MKASRSTCKPGTYQCEMSRMWMIVQDDGKYVFRHEFRILTGPHTGRRIITETCALDVPEEEVDTTHDTVG